MSRILVTGAAGFIGYHVTQRLLGLGHSVVGLDSLNSYYDVGLKRARLAEIKNAAFAFKQIDLTDAVATAAVFAEARPTVVINLAAQPGVRYSLTNPLAYSASNLTGFVNVLECCRQYCVEHLVFASSSSVYGANTTLPYAVSQNVDHPVSLYAATKKANELLAHAYSAMYELPVTGLRFFTVYGPWGRPDMSYYSFTKAILNDEPISLFNHGQMERDFTYIDDVVEGVVRVAGLVPKANLNWSGDAPDPSSSRAPYRIYNIGNSSPVPLIRFVGLLENLLGKPARTRMLPMQVGDVRATFADITDLQRDVGFSPSTPIESGLRKFVDWYFDYHGEKTSQAL